MSGNHFLRSMAEPVAHDPESTTDGPTPEVHFAETVSVVTEVNKLSEAPLVDTPLELTTAGDEEAAKANQQIRRSASRDRDMKDEEGLVLKAVPREPSEEPATAAQTAEVAEGVENLEIASNSSAAKKRKQGTEERSNAPPADRSTQNKDERIPVSANGEKPQSKVRKGSIGGKRRGSNKTKGAAENEPGQELRRSKRRKST
ncbi:hypothetical protein FRC08_004388 [Ceratobasidium sp. 394]|nr:hypothetical protein FRC08_004388 [Ceratobasidium sp. 394]